MAQTAGEIYGLTTRENPLRFLFQSSSETNKVHVVDLDNKEFSQQHGREVVKYERCTCEHFQFRIEPLIRSKTVLPDTPQARCKHIRRAREMLATNARDMLMKFMRKKP